MSHTIPPELTLPPTPQVNDYTWNTVFTRINAATLMKLYTPQKLPLFEGGVYLKVVVTMNCFKIVFLFTFNLFGTFYSIWGGSAWKGYLFRLQVYERVEISLVEVYKKVKRIKGGNMHFMAVKKSRKRSGFEVGPTFSRFQSMSILAIRFQNTAENSFSTLICIGNSMICSDIWQKYHERYFEIFIRDCTSR